MIVHLSQLQGSQKKQLLRLAPQIHRPAVAPRDVSDRLTRRSDAFASLVLAFLQDNCNNIHVFRGSEVGFKFLFRWLPQETLMALGRVEHGEGWWPLKSAGNLGSKIDLQSTTSVSGIVLRNARSVI